MDEPSGGLFYRVPVAQPYQAFRELFAIRDWLREATHFCCGRRPAYYVRADHFQKQQWEDHVMSFATPFWPEYRPAALHGAKHLGGRTVDYSHEREWRVPHHFTFEYSQVEFVVVKSYEDMARFPKPLKDAIGRDRFILVEIYQNIEALWPTHIL